MSLSEEIERKILYELSQLPQVQQAFIDQRNVPVDSVGAIQGLAVMLQAIRRIALPILADEIDAIKERLGDTEADG